MKTEKRKHRRLDSLNTVAYFCLDEEGTVIGQGMGRTLNLSASGILLQTYRPIEGCLHVWVHIGLAEELVEVKGKLVHGRREPSAGFCYGIEFVDLAEAGRARLLEFVECYKRKGANDGAGCI